MEILIQCARVNPEPGAVRRAAARVEDWNVVREGAARHGLGMLLYWGMRRCCADLVPAQFWEDLQRAFHANAARNLMMAAELRAVMAWLAAAGVPAIAYKGPTLAAWAYGNIALREFSDLDILVRPEDRALATRTLAAKGCRERGATGAEQLPGNFEIGFHTPNGTSIDLHWDVSPPYLPPFDTEAAWDRVHPVELGGGLVPTFGADDLFICLALHGARHCWFSLAWVSDVAYLVAAAPLQWDRLLGDVRTRRIVRVAALLAADMLAAPVPDDVVTEARRDSPAAAVARQISEGMFEWTGDVAGQPTGALMHLRMMGTLRDRGRYLWRRGLQANQTDNDLVALPRPLLYAVRPFRVLAKLASRF